MLDGLLARIREWRRQLMDEIRTHDRVIRGIRVQVQNTRPDIDTEHVYARLDLSLGLIEQHQPHHFRRMRRDFARILVQRFACRGAYFPETRTCLVELTFTVNPEFNAAQVAATILHEAMHARIHRMGVRHERVSRAREERFCRRAEIEFGQLAPGGEPVVERALASLESADHEVAPEIDWQLAAQRVAAVDAQARARTTAPDWLEQARRRQRDGT